MASGVSQKGAIQEIERVQVDGLVRDRVFNAM